MQKGSFQFRKWASNAPEFLRDLSVFQSETTDFFLMKDETIKVLGLSWIPSDDIFRFLVHPLQLCMPTKRILLSFIARLYDLLGWAAPDIVVAKKLLQELWLLCCE